MKKYDFFKFFFNKETYYAFYMGGNKRAICQRKMEDAIQMAKEFGLYEFYHKEVIPNCLYLPVDFFV